MHSSLPWLQAEDFAKHNYQCWGVEFRGQGSLPAPPGNLVDLYLSDLFAVVDSLSLRGPLPVYYTLICDFSIQRYEYLLLMCVPFAAIQDSVLLLSTFVIAVVVGVSWSYHCYHCTRNIAPRVAAKVCKIYSDPYMLQSLLQSTEDELLLLLVPVASLHWRPCIRPRAWLRALTSIYL